MDIEFLNELNEPQREATMTVEGPLMVIAGAGSGKTRVLTYRLAFILSQGLADPEQLLALTFTNKAAREMKNRIYKLVGTEARGIVMGTFHSIFARIMRFEAERIGYTSHFSIYDTDDSISLIKTLLKEQKLDDKTYKPRIINNTISSCKTRLMTPHDYKGTVTSDFQEKAALIYELYEKRCLKANAMDFGDLLMKPVFLFRDHPEVLHKYQHHFKYIMVDEYQDTNHVQYLLCKMLAASHENICVVGDDAQSIYSFRGANIQNILNFKKDYPDAGEIKLEQNYRSTQNIVEAANGIIARNKDQIHKRVFTENDQGDPIGLVVASSDQDEAHRVVSQIREQRQMRSFQNKEFAILYRTNAQSRAFEDSLRRANIPYRIYGGLSFYQRKEIKDVVAYLRLAINQSDEQALKRVINYPARGIGKTSINKMVVAADNYDLTLWEVLQQVHRVDVSTRARNAVQKFVKMIERFMVESNKGDAYEAASFIAKESGLLKDLHTSEIPEDLSRWENVQELLNAAKEFVENPEIEENTLEYFLAEIALFTDQDQKDGDDNRVNLMTIHASKGLEFNSVFVVGLEEDLFPSTMAETREDLEEERRLFYVAVTRAMKCLSLSMARSRYRFGQLQFHEPSRFLDEVDPKYLRSISGGMPTTKTRTATKRRAPEKPKTLFAKQKSTPMEMPADFEPSDPKLVVPGVQVRHLKFGVGKVLAVEEVGTQKKATVFFQSSGKKHLLLKYAKLQVVG